MITIYTIQIARWREAKKRGILFVDTTVKSGNPRFAPSWDMVSRYKAGTLSKEEYTELYRERMRVSFAQHPDFWKGMLREESIAFGCYCPKDTFCHRHILVEIFVLCCKYFNIEYTLGGEI